MNESIYTPGRVIHEWTTLARLTPSTHENSNMMMVRMMMMIYVIWITSIQTVSILKKCNFLINLALHVVYVL